MLIIVHPYSPQNPPQKKKQKTFGGRSFWGWQPFFWKMVAQILTFQSQTFWWASLPLLVAPDNVTLWGWEGCCKCGKLPLETWDCLENTFLELVIGWTQWWRIGGTIGGTLPDLKNSSIDAAPNLPSPNLKYAPRSYCWWRSSLTTSYVKAKLIHSRTRISTIPSCFIPVVSSFQLQSRRSPGPYPANKKVLRKHKKRQQQKKAIPGLISWKLFYTPFGSILPFCVGIPWLVSHPTIRNVPGIWPEPSWRHRAIQHWPCRRFQYHAGGHVTMAGWLKAYVYITHMWGSREYMIYIYDTCTYIYVCVYIYIHIYIYTYIHDIKP